MEFNVCGRKRVSSLVTQGGMPLASMYPLPNIEYSFTSISNN